MAHVSPIISKISIYVESFFTWHEMLCEGPTCEIVDSQQFLNIRKAFLSDFYQIEIDEYAFQEDLKIFNNLDDYSDIILWFEYDLFCHVNLIAIISLLQQKKCITSSVFSL